MLMLRNLVVNDYLAHTMTAALAMTLHIHFGVFFCTAALIVTKELSTSSELLGPIPQRTLVIPIEAYANHAFNPLVILFYFIVCRVFLLLSIFASLPAV